MSKYLVMISFVLLFATQVSATGPCLKYEPEVVELKGHVKRIIFPGPPNYESIKDGDSPEQYYVFFLPKAICVQGDPKDELNAEAENGVESIQMMITDYKKFRPLLGKNVNVKGTLMHSFTGHHNTPVLIRVESMTPAAD